MIGYDSFSVHLTAITYVFGPKLNTSSCWSVPPFKFLLFVIMFPEVISGPWLYVFLGFLVFFWGGVGSLISPHKSVPPFPSSFLLLFSELSPICLHISTAGCLNIICGPKSHLWRNATNESPALNPFKGSQHTDLFTPLLHNKCPQDSVALWSGGRTPHACFKGEVTLYSNP